MHGLQYPHGPKFAQNHSISISQMVLKIIDIFNSRQNSRWQPEFGKLKTFQRHYIQGL